MTFKIGDKVYISQNPSLYLRQPIPGVVYTIIKHFKDGWYWCRSVDGLSVTFYYRDFKLAKPKGPYLSNQGTKINV